jgi:D-glycero-alpha-D-manno-heptose-7-phosphate kinase
MIIAKCPLRISFVGGSTDTEAFLDKYDIGSVVSCTPNLYTFVTIHNSNIKKYIINYSKKEVVDFIDEIQNDIVRECFKHFNTGYCTVTFNSSILSSGSGLASSSSYTISMIKALSIFHNIEMTDIEICNLAFQIEKSFNPLAGMQDIYGCGIGGFKRIFFQKNKPPSFKFLDLSFITNISNMYLLNTGVVRNSTNVLKTLNVEKSFPLLELTNKFENIICNQDKNEFFNSFNDGWIIKKKTSQEIANNESIIKIDNILSKLEYVMAHKLCGAGGGGYFLVFVDVNKKYDFEKKITCTFPDNQLIGIGIDSTAIRGFKL